MRGKRSTEGGPANKGDTAERTGNEREQVVALTINGAVGVRRYKRAQAQPAAAAGETDVAIGAGVGLHHVTLGGARKRFVEDGLDAALDERWHPGAARKPAFHAAPRHGSRLDTTETERSAPRVRCPDRRTGDRPTLEHEVAAREAERNRARAMAAWRCTGAA